MESRRPEHGGATGVRLPEIPPEPLEFLARSWSASALQVSKALQAPSPASLRSTIGQVHSASTSSSSTSISSSADQEEEEAAAAAEPANQQLSFSFTSSATSQLVLERIMSQSEISPLTSGRLSHSSGPLNGCSLTEDIDSPPPVSPSHEFDDVVKYLRSNNTLQPLFTGGRNGSTGGVGGVSTPSGKTVGRWLKERREKKKEEARTHNAQLHAAVSVAGVAAAVAAMAAATAAASASGKNDQLTKTDMAVASAATLVAAQCVEAAESMGADRDHLVSAVSSAVNVRSYSDITTLTAAAATALRGAATLKARALKEVWNVAAAMPVDKGTGTGTGMKMSGRISNDHINGNCNKGAVVEENFLDSCNQGLLARGAELLKRTRKGDLHWKIVSVYIHRTGNVMLKMKSKHVAGSITKKKKNVVMEVCKDVAPWPERLLFDGGEQRRYFGLKTATRGIVEFECKNQREYDIWTQGVSRLLSITAPKNNKCHN